MSVCIIHHAGNIADLHVLLALERSVLKEEIVEYFD